MWGRPKRIIVTGGSGYIGSKLMERLRPKYEHLYNVDNKDSKLNDVRSETWYELEADVLVHLAFNMGWDQAAYDDNVKITDSVQSYMLENPRTQVIYASTAAVYPDEYRSMKEEDVVRDEIPTLYGKAKYYGEEAFLRVRPITILRFANVFGGGGRGIVDQFIAGDTTIHGDGSQVRDFVTVDKIINTLEAAVDDPKKYRGTYNVSSGVGMTILEAFHEYGQGEPKFLKDVSSRAKFSVLDNTKWKSKWQ